MSKRSLPAQFVCKGCHQTIVRKPSPAGDHRRDYCSKYCKCQHWNQQHPAACTRCGSVLSYRGVKTIQCRVCTAHDRAILTPQTSCAVCSALFAQKPNRARQTCSAACAAELRGSRNRGKKMRPFVRVAMERPCRNRCGAMVIAKGSKRCEACVKLAGRSKNHCQRAKRKGAPRDYSVTSTKVFARDGWRCQLCGIRTPQSMQGKCAPNSPEVDHIVSIADGGGHTWDNVQCACRKCNGAKGSKSFGQLRLSMGNPGRVSIPKQDTSLTIPVLRSQKLHFRDFKPVTR